MELSYIGFSIDGDDNDEQEAFSEMLEKEHPFYICEGGSGSWFATIKSGTGSDYLKQATNARHSQIFEYSWDLIRL